MTEAEESSRELPSAFDPQGFDEPEPHGTEDGEELNHIDAALSAAREAEDHTEEEPVDASAASPGGTTTHQSSEAKTGDADQAAQPNSASTDGASEEVKRMREARRKAREEGLRRGPPPSPTGARPSTPWSKPTAGTAGPNPFRDSRVAQAEAEGGPPAWLGTRWREIAPEDQQQAWVYLRRWVDWLVNEYRLYESVVPRCWFRHTQLVEELYAAMCMEHKAWEEGAASLTPMMMWHPNLEAMKQRLFSAVGELGSCGKGTHKPEERIELDYDEDLWRRTAYGRRESTTVERPQYDQEPHLVRARIFDDEGTEVTTPEQIVGVMPIQGAEDPSLLLRRDRTTATAESKIELEAEAVPRAEKVIWEKAEHWSTDEQGGLVAVEWKPITDEPDEEQRDADEGQQETEAQQGPAEIPKESRL